MKCIVTQWDSEGNEIVTETELSTEAYPGQIEDMVAGIKAGLPACIAAQVYAHPIPEDLDDQDREKL